MRTFALMSVLLAVVVAGSHAGGAMAFSTAPAADAFVTDADLDGFGDIVIDGANSVLVGYDAFGPGEHRGVYEFDIQSIPTGAVVSSASLGLNLVGSRFDGTDPNLTLYADYGNGLAEPADFQADNFVTAFTPGTAGSVFEFENVLDVTNAVRQLVEGGADFIVFVIRPNPTSVDTSGALLFSSVEIGSFSDQFFPAQLSIELAANPCAEIIGNGVLRNSNDARFTLSARYKSRTQSFEGLITYVEQLSDPGSGLTFDSTTITGLDNQGDTATITGTGLANDVPVNFTITVSDVPPGFFSIELSNGYSAESSLRQGRIRIADTC